MDFKEAIFDLARIHMTEQGYKILEHINDNLQEVWYRPSSSTGKYHQRADGSVPDIAEHTYEMFYGAVKISAMFPDTDPPTRKDARYTGIILHDALKYGPTGSYPHTTRNHDKEMAETLLDRFLPVLNQHYSKEEISLIFLMIRYHNGRFSLFKKYTNKYATIYEFPPELVLVHMLDFLSTKDCLKFEV